MPILRLPLLFCSFSQGTERRIAAKAVPAMVHGILTRRASSRRPSMSVKNLATLALLLYSSSFWSRLCFRIARHLSIMCTLM